MGKHKRKESAENDNWNLTAKTKPPFCPNLKPTRRPFTSVQVMFVVVLTYCFTFNVKWAFATGSSSSSSHVSVSVISSSEFNNRLDESLQQLHQHNDIKPQEDESFLLNEIDDDVQCKFCLISHFNPVRVPFCLVSCIKCLESIILLSAQHNRPQCKWLM